jgi:hypothetical protein
MDEMFDSYDGYYLHNDDAFLVRVWVCNVCGSVVHDREKHFDTHPAEGLDDA